MPHPSRTSNAGGRRSAGSAVVTLGVVAEKGRPCVELSAVDEVVLEQLVLAATTDAAADEVTPPLTEGPWWTATRVTWLKSFHRDRRAGLDGPVREATWAIAVDTHVVGSARLKHSDEQGVVETGLWLTRSARGRGVGRAAMVAVLRQAAGTGAAVVVAETTVANASALAVLQHLGFDAAPTDDGRGVRAILRLTPTKPSSAQGPA